MNPVHAAVHEAVAAILGRPADEDTPFQDAGLTSLMTARLRIRLEKSLSRTIPVTALTEHYTIAALARYLAAGDEPLSAGPEACPAGALPVAPDAFTASSRPAGRGEPADASAPAGPGTPDTGDRRVAVVGMAARFPGARDVDEFWRNLRAGVCSVGEPLTDADAFDAAFFGITPKDAERTDPAHRLLLECCHHALEDGGYAQSSDGTRIGVYAGSGMNLYGPQPPYYARADATDDPVEAIGDLIGGQADFLATRVAYRLGLTGPAVTVQTACSTSLVAVHLAAQAVLTGDADLALAGAAAVRYTPIPRYRPGPGYILSPSGVCRAFDAKADGTVGGDGVAVVLLKRLDRALADGDRIHAVLLGSAVNNDGRAKPGFTAPSVHGHADAVRQALARSGAGPETIGYVEAHGTGTEVGDPAEFQALSQALSAAGGRVHRCALGSVKPSVGHLDTCSGMAGLIKTVLMLAHGELVPTVNVTEPHPGLPWEDSPFTLVTQHVKWPAGATPRRAGVSALGFGGTNAHVVLEEPPAPGPAHRTRHPGEALVPLSAPDPDSLLRLVRRLRDRLSELGSLPAGDVARSLALGRPHLACRTAVSGRTAAGLARALDPLLARPPAAAPPLGPLTFAFSGQGGGPVDLERHRDHPEFRAVVTEHRELLGPPQVEHLVYQLAMARLWRTAGIEPGYVIGHSLGELAALCVAGALTVADAVRFADVRDRLMRSTGAGAMLALVAPLDLALEAAAGTGCDLAAINAPTAHVLSGTEHAVASAESWLDGRKIPHRRLAVATAYHSSLLDPVLDELAAEAGRLDWRPLRIPLAGPAFGELLPTGSTPGPDYLTRQARFTVLFDPALRELGAAGCRDFVEIAPERTLAGPGRRVLPGSNWFSYGHDALAELYQRGARLDWAALTGSGPRAPLPGHPFARTRFPW
ncbi:beta-ketoacyl synthase N-terminal-like domain-containing protein [Streptomyces longwoodensis]|uniref:type I polyketide synthase n=1 Tax=Streptomyces longwoodensis TaxID=68231 RepID=UPI0033D45C42